MNTRQIMYGVLLASLLSTTAFAQDGAVKPLDAGESHTNTSGEDEFILSNEALTKFLEASQELILARKKINLLQERLVVLEDRVALSDSSITLGSVESSFWYEKLLETDKALEEERIRLRNSRLLWFAIGAVTAGVVIAAK
ncbi:MAG: hypothetical protein JSW54_11175 [Fidelibacterota bacterium]|nr:MAG: hypothetical protein JSW54_11175 [Candidatus Neomarinimicrobiota bacterium]